MPCSEFTLIDRYFKNIGPSLHSTHCGIGDDCAVLKPAADQLLLVTTDTLVENIHFLPDVDPKSLGHKVLAVNLSDLAAMGATPSWVTLALSMPEVNEIWLESFARGFCELAERYEVQLIGGDTTRGPLTITVQALGSAKPEAVLYRSKARPGDGIYVTGTLGDAGLALKYRKEWNRACPEGLNRRLDWPEPRIEAGLAIAGIASACIDISDGFLADLGHLIDASGVGATLDWQRIPLTACVRQYVEESEDYPLPLGAGDDYELCFTIPAQREPEFIQIKKFLPHACSRVGSIDSKSGLRIENCDLDLRQKLAGYEHFS